MPKTKATEREFQGKVVTWIQKMIDQGGLSFQGVTQDSSLYGLDTVRFPDVLLTLDSSYQRPFCGWELKPPTIDARDKELLEKAVEKAHLLDAKYFVTWNMQTAIIWRTPEKTRKTVTEKDKQHEFGPIYAITKIDDIRDEQKALLLEDLCAQILRDLDRLHHDENINLPLADTTFFVNLIASTSDKLEGTILTDLNKARANKNFNKRLRAWAKKQGVSKYDQDYYQTLAQQITYKIIGKILFYMTLKRYRSELPRMELPPKSYKTAMMKMRSLFQQALEVDYQAIFETDITDEIDLSVDTSKIIIQLTENLSHWSFELMSLDVIGNVFEKLIPQEARHSLGQYFTPDNLVDLIVSFCIKDADDYVMDPTCGTGTFLIRSYNRLRHFKRKPHHSLLEQIWGFDIAAFPAELATINLYRQDFNDYSNFPRILAKDFFEVMPGQSFEFPPPKKSIKTGERIKVEIPKFDVLLGNFPYIRQELIEKENKGYKDTLEKVLFENWGKEYSSLFEDRTKGGKTNHILRLSGQADIYAYLFFHAAAHLKDGGRMGFVTSNSWLDVAYGFELQKFFLSKFKIIAICESRCEPWFEQSAVNTIFTVLERSDDTKKNNKNYVKFVKIKKPLAELLPQDPLFDMQGRWIHLDQFVDRIETSEFLKGSGCRTFSRIDEEYVKQPEIASCEDEEFRIRIIKQGDLREQLENEGQTVKWGQYLRAPDIYFEIIEKCADNLIPLKKLAKIRRGITTGINEFFYLNKDQIKERGIERRFIKPVITTTKEIPKIFVDEKKLNKKIFICHKDKKDLVGTNALRYIRWAEKHSKEWPLVPSVKNRKYWYSVQENEISDFLILRFRDRRHYTPINIKNLPVGDVVFVGEFKKKEHNDFGCAFLNSFLTALFAEIFGRTNLGDGLLTTYGPEIEELPIPLKDFDKKSQKGKINKILKSFENLGKRRVLDFDKEFKRKERILFEKEILDFLGLGDIKYKDLCNAVNQLIEERHLLPKLRSVKRKKREAQNYAKLREEIIEEIMPKGFRIFPEGFIKGWAREECEEIVLPLGQLKLGETGICVQEICDSEGNHVMEVESEERGKFIVYAKKKDEVIVKVPKNPIVMIKAIKDYEISLRELKAKLFTAFMEKCGDYGASENLTRQVLQEFSLPEIFS